MVSLLSDTGELQGRILNRHALCKENMQCLCGCLGWSPWRGVSPALPVALGGLGCPGQGLRSFQVTLSLGSVLFSWQGFWTNLRCSILCPGIKGCTLTLRKTLQ